ncbi:MAG: FtsH protease activity modulator HflK [Betaproteobacteria bacterium]|nr:FtsH protease activity modulator HflK [Betaproteobacteria bacterium]
MSFSFPMPLVFFRRAQASQTQARPRPLAAGDGDPDWGRGGRGGPGGVPPDGDRRNQRPGGSGGPPDLDELWRDFNRKLNGLFGRRGGGGGGGGGFRPPRRPGSFQPSPRMLSRALLVAVLLLVLGWLGSGFFVVQQGQVAVVTRLGAVTAVEQPGLNWHYPSPFGRAVIVGVDALRTQPVGDSTVGALSGAPMSSMLTADGNIVDIRLSVQWRVGQALDYVFGDRDPEAAVSQAAKEAIRSVVAGLTLEQVLHGDRSTLARSTQQRVQTLLDRWKSGVRVTDLSVQRVEVPEPVRPAYAAADKAREQARQLRAQAQAYAQDVLPRAKGTADTLEQQAEGYKASVVAQAQGDAARFDLIYQQYRKAPQVTRESMYLQTMQQILSSVTKVMVTSHGSDNLLYLPLDKLLQAGSSPAAAGAGARGGAALPLPGGLAGLTGPSQGPAPGSSPAPAPANAAAGTAQAAASQAAANASNPSPAASAAAASDDLRDQRDTLRQRTFR